MPHRLAVTTSYSSRQMQTSLSRRLTVGDVAAYLSQVEDRVSASTLEVAHPVQPDQTLDALNLHGGDRVVVFMQPPRPATLPATARPGDHTLTLRSGTTEFHSRGKRKLLVGRPDDVQGVIPDVDLREVVPPEHIDYVSRSALWLIYEGETWYVARTGQNQVMVNEYSVGEQRFPVSHGQRISIYRGSDNIAQSRPLVEFAVTVRTVAKDNSPQPTIEYGQERVSLRMGSEHTELNLRASGNITVEQLLAGIVEHSGHPQLLQQAQAYHMRLVAPAQRLPALDLQTDDFLYAPLHTQLTRSTLKLRDVHGHHIFDISAAGQDEEKRIGTRLQPNEFLNTIDIDLYDAFAATGNAPYVHRIRSPFLLRVNYHADEGIWWGRIAERSQIPVYLNTERLTSRAMPLTPGDVLTLGSNTSDYFARLEADVTNA
ncbi:MAG: hypothetical protein AAF787_06900 [Chloroflexota bacterium]